MKDEEGRISGVLHTSGSAFCFQPSSAQESNVTATTETASPVLAIASTSEMPTAGNVGVQASADAAPPGPQPPVHPASIHATPANAISLDLGRIAQDLQIRKAQVEAVVQL